MTIYSFLTTILSDKDIALQLFNIKELFLGSEDEKDMAENIKNKVFQDDKRSDYIAKNTRWLYIDHEHNLIGTLNEAVVQFNSDGQFEYLCEGIQNIPLLRIEYLHWNKEYKEHIQFIQEKYKIDFEELLSRYENICKKFNLKLGLDKNLDKSSQEFEEKLINKYE